VGIVVSLWGWGGLEILLGIVLVCEVDMEEGKLTASENSVPYTIED
jgi:hypothetical protein